MPWLWHSTFYCSKTYKGKFFVDYSCTLNTTPQVKLILNFTGLGEPTLMDSGLSNGQIRHGKDESQGLWWSPSDLQNWWSQRKSFNENSKSSCPASNSWTRCLMSSCLAHQHHKPQKINPIHLQICPHPGPLCQHQLCKFYITVSGQQH